MWAFSLALFSIYLQVFLPLGLATAASRTADDGYSNRIVICTPFGIKLIYDARGQEVPPEEGGIVDCLDCIAKTIGTAATLPSAAVVIPIQRTSVERSVAVVYALPFGIEASSAYLTRAPPVSV